MGKIAQAYAKLRTGRSFLIFVSFFCLFWCLWNYLAPKHYKFDDPGFPVLTLILSIEASIAASVIIMSTSESDEKQKEQLKYILHLTEAILALLEHSKLNLLNQNLDAKNLTSRQKENSCLKLDNDST